MSFCGSHTGALVTWLFLPDTTGLDLKEQESWQCIREGREDYRGVTVHARHISLWERLRGAGPYDDPERDFVRKIEDMRIVWLAAKQGESEGSDLEEDCPKDIAAYFESTMEK